jgi:hypothetical protein
MMRALAASAFLTLLGACGDGPGERPALGDRPTPARRGAEASAAAASAGSPVASTTWEATATDGSMVSVGVGARPPAVGSTSLEISVEGSAPQRSAISVDLLSPTMPAHGIVRYPVVDGSVTLDLPMAGRWAIYVTLNAIGENTAEFVFDVEAHVPRALAGSGANSRSSLHKGEVKNDA